MGLPFNLVCAVFCDKVLELHFTNLQQGYDIKKPQEDQD